MMSIEIDMQTYWRGQSTWDGRAEGWAWASSRQTCQWSGISPPLLPGLKYWSIPPKFKPLTWTNVIDCSASEDDMWRRRQQTTMLIGGIYEVLTPTRRCLSHPTRLRGDDIFQHGKCHAVIIEQGNCAADSTTFNYKDNHAHGPEWILYLYLDDVKRSSFFLILFYFGAGEFAATYFTSYLVLTNWSSSLCNSWGGSRLSLVTPQ